MTAQMSTGQQTLNVVAPSNLRIWMIYQDIGSTTNFGMNDNVFSRDIVLTSSGGSLWETCCGSPVTRSRR